MASYEDQGMWFGPDVRLEAAKEYEANVNAATAEFEARLKAAKAEYDAKMETTNHPCLGSVGQGPGEAALENTTMGLLHTCDTMHTVYAPGVTLISSPDPTDETAQSAVVIQALGTETLPGAVQIFGSGVASIAGGDEAYATVQTVGEEGAGAGLVTIDAGAAGTLWLCTGFLPPDGPAEPNYIVMSAAETEGGGPGIVVSSTELITLLADENSLEVDPEAGVSVLAGASAAVFNPDDGIAMSVGGASIAITNEAITITFGDNVITLSAEGITLTGAAVTLSDGTNTVSLAGPEGLGINGGNVVIAGDESVEIDGLATTLG